MQNVVNYDQKTFQVFGHTQQGALFPGKIIIIIHLEEEIPVQSYCWSWTLQFVNLKAKAELAAARNINKESGREEEKGEKGGKRKEDPMLAALKQRYGSGRVGLLVAWFEKICFWKLKQS